MKSSVKMRDQVFKKAIKGYSVCTEQTRNLNIKMIEDGCTKSGISVDDKSAEDIYEDMTRNRKRAVTSGTHRHIYNIYLVCFFLK